MSSQKQTLPLLLSLILTIGLVFGGLWFLMERWAQINGRNNPIPSPTSTPTENIISQVIKLNPPATSCNISNLPQGVFNYGGSTTWAPIRRDVDVTLKTSCPQFDLRYTQPINEKPGSGTGIKMLLANQLAFSQSSRPIKPEEYAAAQTKGFTLKEIPIAIDGIAIAVNHNLNIPGLTVAQLKDIYTGKITNWKQVGGKNLPIIPLSRNKESGGTVEFFIENVLNKEDLKNVKYIGTTTEAIRKVSINLGAIYYASAPEIVPQCTIKSLPIGRTNDQFITPYQEPVVAQSQCFKQPNRLNIQDFHNGKYPITRNLFVIVKQNSETDQQVGEAYANWLLEIQNQELIEKAGFVRIK